MSHPAAPYALPTAPEADRTCCFTGPGLAASSVCRNCPAPPAAPVYKMPTPEAQALFSEARLGQECGLWLQSHNRQAYDCFFHIPNGGLRTVVEGQAFKMQHAKAGVPDYYLAMPQCEPDWGKDEPWKSHGLFIELKTRTGRVAPAQTEWHARLRQQGYRVEVVRSLPEFISLLTEYLA